MPSIATITPTPTALAIVAVLIIRGLIAALVIAVAIIPIAIVAIRHLTWIPITLWRHIKTRLYWHILYGRRVIRLVLPPISPVIILEGVQEA